MYKLDLANMRYTRSVDLAPYSCVPTNIQFPALCEFYWSILLYTIDQFLTMLYPSADGFVILQCEEPVTGRATGQLLLDYVTDAVLAHKPGLVGRPLISPDSRHLVTLDRQESGVILVVQEISREYTMIKQRFTTDDPIFILFSISFSERFEVFIRRKDLVEHQRHYILPVSNDPRM